MKDRFKGDECLHSIQKAPKFWDLGKGLKLTQCSQVQKSDKLVERGCDKLSSLFSSWILIQLNLREVIFSYTTFCQVKTLLPFFALIQCQLG